MQDFEKLGVFYLGREIDPTGMEDSDRALLYDSSDLTTHAAIIGMTGSGKTGLGVALIEEAAIDHIPVLAVDPKGDLPNLLLSFPNLDAEDFEPWVDPRTAATQGQSPAEYAAVQADLWRKGLADWGQGPERIGRMRNHADFAVYTPGSSAGVPLAVLGRFDPPAADVRDDRDLYAGLISGTTTSLLALLDLNTDPVTGKEHILIANILQHCWDRDQGLDLPGLIAAIQEPPCRTIGVLDVDSFMPAKQRFDIALRINSLLASPGFAAWMEGAPFDIDRLLYNESGKPRVAVLAIAHLNDRERMFFVTMLLHAVLAWMRRQSGSPTLRALLYIDELFGYMPPVANPPSKEPLLTLLKQARAFGLGVVLSTQNPVDLDYKGLGNIGSWFIGRLQTERDRQRLLDGLKSASGTTNSAELDRLLAGLGKRCFLLNNVHDKGPVLFRTRWVMSYLAGPLSRDQIRQLAAGQAAGESPAPVAVPPGPTQPAVPAAAAVAPVVEPGVQQVWLQGEQPLQPGEELVYQPLLLAKVSVHYSQARLNLHQTERLALLLPVDGMEGHPDWSEASEVVADSVLSHGEPVVGARFAALPGQLARASSYSAFDKQLRSWLRIHRPLQLWHSAELRVTSQPGESERDFRIRLQQLGNERRDAQLAKLRQQWDAKFTRMEARLLRARQAHQRHSQQASSSKLDATLSMGTALLGALLGRKAVSATTISRAGTAARRAGMARKRAGDVDRAAESLEQVEQEMAELQQAFEADIARQQDYDAQHEALQPLLVKATAANIQIEWLGVGWRPGLSQSRH